MSVGLKTLKVKILAFVLFLISSEALSHQYILFSVTMFNNNKEGKKRKLVEVKL